MPLARILYPARFERRHGTTGGEVVDLEQWEYDDAVANGWAEPADGEATPPAAPPPAPDPAPDPAPPPAGPEDGDLL